jgi:glycosyltransferase involved in cell wall biosynthesis
MSQNQTLNVLHIIGDLDDGGVEKVLYELCVGDKANSHTVISLKDKGKYGHPLSVNGIRVECLQMPAGRVTLEGIRILLALIRSISPSIIQTWMYHGSLIGSIAAKLVSSAPIYWSIHHGNLSIGTVKRSTRLVSNILRYLSYLIPKKIIYCAYQSLTLHASLGYRKTNSIVIQNGYNFDMFKPDNLVREKFRHSLILPVDIPLFGMVARFDPQKDHNNLFRAISILKQRDLSFLFILVGSGMTLDNSALSALVDRYNIKDRLIFLGQRQDIPAVMNGIDIHVLSSLGEAFPNVLAESMACGTPCVSTEVGDAALIVGETGWIVPPQSPEGLANGMFEALRCFVSDKAKWNLRKLHARERVVDNFSIDKLVYSYTSLWIN